MGIKKRRWERRKVWLEMLREGTDAYESLIDFLEKLAEDGGIPLENLGTSEKEFGEFIKKGSLIAAQKWLGYLRQETVDYIFCFRGFWQELSKGDHSLADLGINLESLEEIRKKCAKNRAIMWLVYARKSDNPESRKMYHRFALEEAKREELFIDRNLIKKAAEETKKQKK